MPSGRGARRGARRGRAGRSRERLDRRLVGLGAAPIGAAPNASRAGTRAAPLETRLRPTTTRGPAGGRDRRATARPSRGRTRSSRRTTGRTAGSCQRPCSFAYVSTSATRSSGRPVARAGSATSRRRSGKIVHVDPYSGDMLPIVARFSSGNATDTFAVELDELADHTVLAQQLGDGQHEVGRGDADGQRADELDADDARQQHRERLTEHRGLGLDAADAPTEHSEPVDHRRVRVGADEGVGIHEPVRAAEHDLREVLEVHLVTDAAVRAGTRATSGTPTAPSAGTCSARGCAANSSSALRTNASEDTGDVGDDRMVDHEVDRNAGLDRSRVAAEVGHRVAHRREVDDRGHTGEVLHQHARGHELQLAMTGLCRGTAPIGERADVVGADVRLRLRVARGSRAGFAASTGSVCGSSTIASSRKTSYERSPTDERRAAHRSCRESRFRGYPPPSGGIGPMTSVP